MLRRGVCIGSKRKLSPACGRRGPFHGGKGPKTPCAGRTPVRHRASPVPCASRRMRAGTNSHILVLKQWCLAPAFGCDAQRALRRVVALGPHIRSEEHTSELQSLMRNSYAVFCLKNKKTTNT